MKRLILLIFMLISTASLSSCTVNWIENGGQVHYDVPWWVIAIPVVIVLAIIIIYLFRISSTRYYTCPNCNHKFKAKWYKCFFTTQTRKGWGGKFKCPKCRQKSVMRGTYIKDEPFEEKENEE